MSFINQWWWIILLILIGVIYNAIKDLNKLSFKKYVDSKKKPDDDVKKD